MAYDYQKLSREGKVDPKDEVDCIIISLARRAK